MKKYKKIIIMVLLLACIFVYIGRVWYVNENANNAVTKVYASGEIVPFEKDFYHTSDMMVEGYRIQILDHHVYTKEDFIDKYSIRSQVSDFTNFFYTVDVKIYNDNDEIDEEHGIYLLLTYLTSLTDVIMADDDTTLEVNSSLPSIQFSLRPHSEMEVTIVYELNEPYYTDIKEVEDTDFKLQISEYPTRKLLKIKK